MSETMNKRIETLKSMENIITNTLPTAKAFEDWCNHIKKNINRRGEHFIQLAEDETIYLKTCEKFKEILNKYSKNGFLEEENNLPDNTITVRTATKSTKVSNFKELAETICEYGKTEDLAGYNQFGEQLFNTFGIYLDKVSDMKFRENLLKYLIPMQKNIFIKEDIKTLEEKLLSVYSAETSFDGENWNKDNPTYGHCAVVSLIVNDYFDNAEICKIKVDGVSHYFNRINNEIIDLTGKQFSKNLNYSDYEISSRDYLLSNKNTTTRYEILKSKLSESIDF